MQSSLLGCLKHKKSYNPMVTIIMITVGQFSLMIVTKNIGDFDDDVTDTTDDNDLDGFK